MIDLRGGMAVHGQKAGTMRSGPAVSEEVRGSVWKELLQGGVGGACGGGTGGGVRSQRCWVSSALFLPEMPQSCSVSSCC